MFLSKGKTAARYLRGPSQPTFVKCLAGLTSRHSLVPANTTRGRPSSRLGANSEIFTQVTNGNDDAKETVDVG